jgi:NitT/TauT family transport system substrate-binding protein
MQIVQNRRRFLANAIMASIAGLTGLPKSLHAEPPPETTTVRIRKYTGPDATVCDAPKYVAAELLRAEGFIDVRYVEHGGGGELDFDVDFAPSWISWIDIDGEPWNEPWTVLTGLHSGCLQLIADDTIQTVRGLKGKRVGVPSLTSSGYQLMTLMAAYVGLDPGKDIEWIVNDKARAIELFTDRKIDAFLGAPPDPQEVLAHKIGHTILNTTFDHPWSQYYCCLLGGTADFVRRYPIATKRVVRAFLKAADICHSQPALAARSVVDYGITEKYDYSLEGLTEARYDRWRDFDPDDTLRFYALRMQEVGFIKSSPEQIIAKGTNWQFLNELKRELKT